MRYYIKRLGSQELGSVRDGRAQRGRYIYISKDDRVLDFFPPLSRTVLNDSSVIPIVPLYSDHLQKIYCNFVYHNDRFQLDGGTRNEYRIYCNSALEEGTMLFQSGDILIFREGRTSQLNTGELTAAIEDTKLYFLYRCSDHTSQVYNFCNGCLQNSEIRGGAHAVFEGEIADVEQRISEFASTPATQIETVIDNTVTARAQNGVTDNMAHLFNSNSFRDFVMCGYEYKCAITGNVIGYGSFYNLEAAHIWPRSHQGLYMPSNGIALCRDMHWAFDKGLFTVDDTLKVLVHPDVQSEYLQQYNHKQIFIPANQFFRPDINNLHYHQSNVYGLFRTSGSLINAPGYGGTQTQPQLIVAEQISIRF